MIEILRQALEWIEAQPEPRMIGATSAISNLRAAIKQQEEAEPVAWTVESPCNSDDFRLYRSKFFPIPLYTAPVTPAGWKLVPIEPTREMLWQICPASADLREWEGNYKSMLAAAPEYGK